MVCFKKKKTVPIILNVAPRTVFLRHICVSTLLEIKYSLKKKNAV